MRDNIMNQIKLTSSAVSKSCLLMGDKEQRWRLSWTWNFVEISGWI